MKTALYDAKQGYNFIPLLGIFACFISELTCCNCVKPFKSLKLAKEDGVSGLCYMNKVTNAPPAPNEMLVNWKSPQHLNNKANLTVCWRVPP